MPGPNGEMCADCYYFGLSVCRESSPTIDTGGTVFFVGVWPTIGYQYQDWCGKFRSIAHFRKTQEMDDGFPRPEEAPIP